MSFPVRFFFAFACFFHVLFNRQFASGAARLAGGLSPQEVLPPKALEATTASKTTDSARRPETQQDDPEAESARSARPSEAKAPGGLRSRSPKKPPTVPPPAPDESNSPLRERGAEQDDTEHDEQTEVSDLSDLDPPSSVTTDSSDQKDAEVIDEEQAAVAAHSELNVEDERASEVPVGRAEPAPASEAALKVAAEDGALLLLSVLQREGRLVDFLKQPVLDFSDEQIGAAARAVHAGCVGALKQYIEIEPIETAEEGDSVTLQEGFDANAFKLSGNVSGKAPFRGTVIHRGWRATKRSLPQRAATADADVLVPAEIEI